MIVCKELNQSFETKELLFKALKENKEDIVALKKAQIQKSCEKNSTVVARPLDYLKLSEQVKNIALDDNYYYIVVNTTKVLDSHSDLHLDGLWKRTIKAQQGKNYLVADHKLELEKVIAKKEYIEMFTATIPFALVGKDYEGETQALIYKVRKDKIINKTAKEWLDSGDSIEASVRMQYVDIELAMDSEAKADEAEKKAFDNTIDLIANKSEFEEIPYFWIVKEAKQIQESSLVVFGSNDVTGQLDVKILETAKSTSETIDSSNDTQAEAEKQLTNFLTSIKI